MIANKKKSSSYKETNCNNTNSKFLQFHIFFKLKITTHLKKKSIVYPLFTINGLQSKALSSHIYLTCTGDRTGIMINKDNYSKTNFQLSECIINTLIHY